MARCGHPGVLRDCLLYPTAAAERAPELHRLHGVLVKSMQMHALEHLKYVIGLLRNYACICLVGWLNHFELH